MTLYATVRHSDGSIESGVEVTYEHIIRAFIVDEALIVYRQNFEGQTIEIYLDITGRERLDDKDGCKSLVISPINLTQCFMEAMGSGH